MMQEQAVDFGKPQNNFKERHRARYSPSLIAEDIGSDILSYPVGYLLSACTVKGIFP